MRLGPIVVSLVTIGYNCYTMPMDKSMLENSESRQPEMFKFDERLEWYQINNLLINLARTASSLSIEPGDMVHLGGTANFYRLFKVFGPRAVQHFRGTHDMDVISFQQGTVQRVLDRLVEEYKKEEERFTPPINSARIRTQRVMGYSLRKSLSLPDKKSLYVSLDYRDIPGLSSGYKIDIYESSTRRIRFNNREFTRDKIVFDPPETLQLSTFAFAPGKDKVLVSVPSLRDYFTIKTDIIDFSQSGLRIKDRFDILTLLRICEERDVNFSSLIASLLEANSPASATSKLKSLERLFQSPFTSFQSIPPDYPFFPSRKQIDHALSVVRGTKVFG